MKKPLWEGVYKEFTQVPVEGPGFAGSEWLTNSSKKLDDFKSLAASDQTVPKVTAFTESLLPVIAAVVQGQKRSVRILDFGGGLGFSYYQVQRALASSASVEFHVLDIEEVCVEGRKHFRSESNILFHSSIADIEKESFDIIHIGSSLQYIEDWQATLASLVTLSPAYVLMANIPAGDIETFATAQNYYDSKIACWFFSVTDLIQSMAGLHYELILKSTYSTKVYGVEQPYPLENFDAAHRVDYPCMLLFQKDLE